MPRSHTRNRRHQKRRTRKAVWNAAVRKAKRTGADPRDTVGRPRDHK